MNLPNNPYMYFIVFGIVLAVVEVLLGAAMAFELLILGIILIIAGLTGMVMQSVVVSVITIIVLSLFYFLFGRSFVRNRFDIVTTNTNIDAVMGKKGEVVKKITLTGAGQVKVEGEVWRATADHVIEVGSSVIVRGVSGVTLTVSSE